jgi:MOSC domain-containing protein YiiM
MVGVVTAVSSKAEHGVAKPNRRSIRLLEGLGVEGDAHLGAKVQHRSRAQHDPGQPNLRQVHLMQAELHDEIAAAGYEVAPGEMGENVTTRGIDLLGLPRGARLRLGGEAVVEVTGLRNPCRQLEGLARGLLGQTVEKADDGSLVRKAGIMAIVLASGVVRPGDPVAVELPPGPHRALEVV